MFLAISGLVLALAPSVFGLRRIGVRSVLFLGAAFLFFGSGIFLTFLPAIIGHSSLTDTSDVYFFNIFVYYALIFLISIFVFPVFSYESEDRHKHEIHLSRMGTLYLLLIAIISLSVLCYQSNFMFIKDPRLAYQTQRVGIGFVWVLYLNSISILFFFWMFTKRPTLSKFAILMPFFYFTGSKIIIIKFVFLCYVAFVRYHKKIKLLYFLIAAKITILAFLILFDQFGASQGFLERLSTYLDTERNSRIVYGDYLRGNFTFELGKIAASSFWQYVPRIVYEDKPFVFGASKLIEIYLPHLVGTGATPSFGFLTAEFKDFGFFAPISRLFLEPMEIATIIALFFFLKKGFYFDTSLKLFFGFILFTPGFGFHLPFFYQLILFFSLLIFFKKRQYRACLR